MIETTTTKLNSTSIKPSLGAIKNEERENWERESLEIDSVNQKWSKLQFNNQIQKHENNPQKPNLPLA